ncbi:hypothetical protein BU23DRAFT_553030 [Bimuria novae-zelandiae CBS 107.79]|uniref:Uncharacterized protein n=1 Tax=Bimuria novae-zelandiae CBS 107.79 TaxID=1447943 RepID=A0A6A5VEH2_9PLEO|nr:hypothetical protein BU23DRAFT_553030 [Bimuria novae-zelandiae CBS 107.79]
MVSRILLGLSMLAQLGLIAADSSVTWLTPQRAAVVKLLTPGYPLKEEGSDPDVVYPAAVVLKFELSADNKTLLLEDTPFLPLQNYYIPPRLWATQVPAGMHVDGIRAIAEDNNDKRVIRKGRLELDYDRLVEGDPTGGPPYYNHQPTLRFRIMGLGAEGEDKSLDATEQEIIQVTMRDQNEEGWSNEAARSYLITSVDVLPAEEVYSKLSTELGDHMGPEADQEKECTKTNWKCPDEGVYEAGSPYRTPYRFIWRRRFDQYGRIGSLRHDFVQQWDLSKQKVYEDPLNSALVALGVLLATILAIVSGVKSRAARAAKAKAAAEKAAKPPKKPKAPKVEGEASEESESEDEDAAWLGEMAKEAGEVPMTVDEASHLIDLMSDEEGDLDSSAAIPEKKSKKNKNKRVAFKADADE